MDVLIPWKPVVFIWLLLSAMLWCGYVGSSLIEGKNPFVVYALREVHAATGRGLRTRSRFVVIEQFLKVSRELVIVTTAVEELVSAAVAFKTSKGAAFPALFGEVVHFFEFLLIENSL